ncbi:hypothetical protein [Burkholderia pseudomallei]|uniref:hypothetical protein n=1 Tax=Burkholderia pseudomallei TaxID=28450 RepID=UPI0006AD7475|nr:hypothetical protein [Burkholderia pseudomallei]ALB94502.1 hypothetical protein AM256_13395 [Burkholderia pseudomallei]ALC00576.1 hypothetical protein AM257_13420 [Burkholderia pseudomallei]MBF3536948.1 hypothetical protein [Burkholderia pseudomallei]MBF3602598.1 hypothetical protein [Burkholderia pseudomallei]OMS45770.1 hypothetical protein AQ741_01525 [Burkholderia pseudomallei]
MRAQRINHGQRVLVERRSFKGRQWLRITVLQLSTDGDGPAHGHSFSIRIGRLARFIDMLISEVNDA